jgi:hypothetical protein
MTIRRAWLSLVPILLPLALAACGGDKSSVPKDRPDLQLISMTFDPSHPTAGGPVEVSAMVKNIGTADAPATMSGVTVDGTQTCAEIPTPILPIMQTATVTCSLGVLPAGTHGVGFCADVTNAADEPDESNNCILQMLEVGAGALRP